MKKELFETRACCKDVKDLLIDLCVNVKVRNDSSLNEINSEMLDIEKTHLAQKDHIELVNMIKESIEILISFKMEEEEEEEVKKNHQYLSELNSYSMKKKRNVQP